MTIDKLTVSPSAPQNRWRASVGGGADPFAHSSTAAFTWSGFARDDGEAAGIALNTANLAYRTLPDSHSDAHEGMLPFSKSALHVERVSDDVPNYHDTHHFQLGHPFIHKGGSMEALCFSKEAQWGQVSEDGHRLTRQIKNKVETLLALDPAVARAIGEGRLLQVRFHARAASGARLSQPRCYVGVQVHDRDEIGIPLAKATVDAILLLLLVGLREAGCLRQRTFLYPCQPEYSLIERAQRAFLDRRQKLIEKPNSYLLGTVWDMLTLGHIELVTEIGSMARQSLPMAVSAAEAPENVVKLDRAASVSLPSRLDRLN